MKRIALAAVLLITLVGSARAGFDEGFAAYNRGDYATALKEFRPLAELGDAWAQGMLGGMYGKGYGVAQDYVESVRWYRLAAEQGVAWAQADLGTMYAEGVGVPQNYAEAARW